MSGLVNKVKEALHSSRDTPTGDSDRTGKLNLTPEERERLEAAGYGTSHHADKRHLGATEDITLSGTGHPPSHYLDQDATTTSALPGAFPASQTEIAGGQHKDGREYVAPKGTHVGSLQTTEHKSHDPNLGQPAGRGIPEDTAVHGNKANPIDATPAATGTTAPSSAGVIASQDTKNGPNKLHKKHDPRGHVVFTDPPSHETIHGTETQTSTTAASVGTGTGGHADTTTAVRHSLPGTHPQSNNGTTDVYEQQAARKYDGNNDFTSSNTPNYSYPTSTTTATAAAVGGGALATSQLPERKYHDEPVTTGSRAIPGQEYTTSSGIGSSHSPPRGVGVYNTVTGAGSSDDPIHPHGSSALGGSTQNQTFQSHPGLTTGSQAVPRNAGDSTVMGGHGNTANSLSNAPLPATLTSGGLGSATGTGSAATYGTTTYSQPQNTSNVSSTSPTSVSGGQDHYGPGHVGSKVLHTCTKCGEDNDITHYFKKETIYRLSQ